MNDTSRLFCVALVTTLLAACGGGGGGSTEIVCGEGTTAVLTANGEVVVAEGAAEDLAGAAIAADDHATLPGDAVSIMCATDIVPDGYVALGPAVTFGPAGSWSDRGLTFTLPYKAARLPEGASDRHVRIVARRHVGDGESFFPPVADRAVDSEDAYASRISFHGGELTTYQVVARADAGTPVPRTYTYRGIIGISRGGNAALSIALRNHEKFDLVADLIGEPGPSMKYTLSFIRDYLFGGFCTAADQEAGIGNIGELCTAQQRPVFADQLERKSDYEHFLYEQGDGVGLTLNRNLYIKASRDLARALGNPALYNVDDPYLPPGVDWDYANQPAATRCADPVVLADFFDAEFNPDGAMPVITYCDGGDSTDMGLGVFDPGLPQTNPAEVFLAVDVNGNGLRDSGEPVITNAFEPFADVGSDGVASVDEDGYDAASNPDPAGDDYHYLRNPLGTEKNFDRDEGEDYQDVGLDGIADTCQQGDTPVGVAGCYDFGEGDGEWTQSPNLLRWYESDLSVLYAAMTEAERRRVDIWADAGIRDFLNGSVSANVGTGIVHNQHPLGGSVWNNFEGFPGGFVNNRFDFSKIRWSEIPGNVYLRYGDPDATQAQIEAGDGRHVGTGVQIINRVTTAFSWINSRWPNGDRTTTADGGDYFKDEVLDNENGRQTPYGLFLPPGYDEPANANTRYPVLYFLHGYGQSPEDLVDLSAIPENYMTNPDVPPEERFQKFIIVYVDGRCRPTMDGVPVDPAGDLCERGTFYMDAPLGSPAQMETNMQELMDYIDANYRTRAPETVEVIE